MRLVPWLTRGQPTPAPPRPDPLQIALLEYQLLGIRPAPGTAAAAAIALHKAFATPIDQTTCPHLTVVETSELGQPRPVGLCQRCGADLIQDEYGTWAAP
jgi:hypothetical protein